MVKDGDKPTEEMPSHGDARPADVDLPTQAMEVTQRADETMPVRESRGDGPSGDGPRGDGPRGDGPQREDRGYGEGERLGDYRLVQRLGQGGMGVVYLAVDRRGRAVAVKVLRDHVAHDAAARARLAREVSSLSRVRHPGVAAVIAADTAGRRPYLVTRYVAGPPLDRWVAEHGPLTGGDLVRFARHLSDALIAIHRAGVIHRDLKPSNVLMLDGDPIVIDFGIAHVADDARLTSTGLVMGTPGYLPPEVIESGAVTDATDWWGWAATLAFAASGQPPFGRGRVDAVLHRVTAGQPDLSGVDTRLAPLLAAALHPVPEQRPHRDVILAALDRYAAGGLTTDVLPAIPAPGESGAPTDRDQRRRLRSGVTTQPVAPPPTKDAAAADRTGPPSPPVLPPTQAHPMLPKTTAMPVAAQPTPPPAYVDFGPRPLDHGPGLHQPPAGGVPGAGQPPYASVGGPGALRGAEPAARGLIPGRRKGVEPAAPPVSPGTDPRIGQGKRTGTIAALAVAVCALAAVVPVVALLVALIWSVLARLADRSVTSLVLKRNDRGRRSSDIPLALLASPVHLVGALVSAVLSALLPLIVAILTTFSVGLVMSLTSGLDPDPQGPLPLATAMLVGCVLAWWGAGGTSLRRGTRSLVRGMAPGQAGAVIATTALLLLAAYLGLRTQASGAQPSWWPVSTRWFESLPWS